MGVSRVSCASFSIGTNTTITISRDNKAYTHTLKYSFNGATGTIATKTTQTTYVWTPPASTFYSKIPNTTSGYGTVTCETYNGNTLLGTSTAGFYAYAVRDNCLPTVSGTVVDTNPVTIALTGNSSILVSVMSKPKATMTATAKNNATIKTIQIDNGWGLVATTSPYTFDRVYGDKFFFKATDSRGYSTTHTLDVSGFVDYYPCYFDTTPVFRRSETTSTTATASIVGKCFKGSFGVASNTLTVKYRYKTSNGTYGSYANITPTWNADESFTATVTLTNLSTDEAYTIEFVVEDKLTSFPVETVLGRGTGDLRIAKDYVQTKNDFIVGDENNEAWKSVKVRRKLGNSKYFADFGIGNPNGASAILELFKKEGTTDSLLGRIDLRADGHLYNYLTGRSFAEIASSSPSMSTTGGSGYMYLDGGSPILIQWGRISIVPETANVIASQDVSFIWRFGNVPAIFCEVVNGTTADIQVNPTAMTISGFKANLKRSTVATTAIFWIAIGNGEGSLPE